MVLQLKFVGFALAIVHGLFSKHNPCLPELVLVTTIEDIHNDLTLECSQARWEDPSIKFVHGS